MPNTTKRVQFKSGVYPGGLPGVLVDGAALDGVTRVQIDYSYDQPHVTAIITVVGVDVDLEGAPDYMVRVMGPGPPRDGEED